MTVFTIRRLVRCFATISGIPIMFNALPGLALRTCEHGKHPHAHHHYSAFMSTHFASQLSNILSSVYMCARVFMWNTFEIHTCETRRTFIVLLRKFYQYIRIGSCVRTCLWSLLMLQCEREGCMRGCVCALQRSECFTRSTNAEPRPEAVALYTHTHTPAQRLAPLVCQHTYISLTRSARTSSYRVDFANFRNPLASTPNVDVHALAERINTLYYTHASAHKPSASFRAFHAASFHPEPNVFKAHTLRPAAVSIPGHIQIDATHTILMQINTDPPARAKVRIKKCLFIVGNYFTANSLHQQPKSNRTSRAAYPPII